MPRTGCAPPLLQPCGCLSERLATLADAGREDVGEQARCVNVQPPHRGPGAVVQVAESLHPQQPRGMHQRGRANALKGGFESDRLACNKSSDRCDRQGEDMPGGERLMPVTAQPSSSSRATIAAPMPELAPVTTA